MKSGQGSLSVISEVVKRGEVKEFKEVTVGANEEILLREGVLGPSGTRGESGLPVNAVSLLDVGCNFGLAW